MKRKIKELSVNASVGSIWWSVTSKQIGRWSGHEGQGTERIW
jgi:hypothetical protein